jgi:hypothetical protein
VSFKMQSRLELQELVKLSGGDQFFREKFWRQRIYCVRKNPVRGVTFWDCRYLMGNFLSRSAPPKCPQVVRFAALVHAHFPSQPLKVTSRRFQHPAVARGDGFREASDMVGAFSNTETLGPFQTGSPELGSCSAQPLPARCRGCRRKIFAKFLL